MSTVKRNDDYHATAAATAATSPMVEFEMKDSFSENTKDVNSNSSNNNPPLSSSQTATIATTTEGTMMNEDHEDGNTTTSTVTTPTISISMSPQTPAGDNKNSSSSNYNSGNGSDNSQEVDGGKQDDEQASIDSLSVQSSKTRLSTSYSLASNNIVRMNGLTD